VFTIAVGTLVGISLNLIVDPFHVFGSNWLPYQVQQNERFLKVEFLKRGHDRFNGYLIGSSRIGTTEPRAIEKYLPDARLYNLTVQGATLLDDLVLVRYLLKQGYAFRYAYVQIDIDRILQDYDYPKSLLLYRKHPATIGESFWQFYGDYALAFPVQEMVRKIQWNVRQHADHVVLDVAGTGRWYRSEKDLAVVADPRRYALAEMSFHKEVHRVIGDKSLASNIAALRDLVTLCDQYGVQLKVLIAPNHRAVLDSYVVEDYLRAVRALAGVTEIWDFGAYNSVTLDDSQYYESSHYLPRVGEFMAARVYGDLNAKVPSDFGVLVTQENLSQHLKKLSAEFRARGP